MATFLVEIQIGNPSAQRWITLEALVDTGASTTSVPGSLLRELGVTPLTQNNFRFAQGEVRAMDIGQTWIRVENAQFITQVIFNEEGTTPLLGALALEGAYMAVDPGKPKTNPRRGPANVTPIPAPAIPSKNLSFRAKPVTLSNYLSF